MSGTNISVNWGAVGCLLVPMAALIAEPMAMPSAAGVLIMSCIGLQDMMLDCSSQYAEDEQLEN